MKPLLLLVLITISTGERFKLDDDVSVIFHKAPIAQDRKGIMMYFDQDGEYIYQASRSALREEEIVKLDTAEFLQQFVEGKLSRAKSDQPMKSATIKFKGLMAKSVEFSVVLDNKNIRFMGHSFVFNNTLYDFQVASLAGDLDEKTAAEFFNSIEIKGR